MDNFPKQMTLFSNVMFKNIYLVNALLILFSFHNANGDLILKIATYTRVYIVSSTLTSYP